MKKVSAVLVAAAALAVPTAAAADPPAAPPGQAVQDCAGGASFGQVVSSAEPGFNLGQHQKGVHGPGGARGFVESIHCEAV